MAFGRRRLNLKLMKQALDSTAKLSTFVLFILIGSTVFSFTFNAADGHIWVEHLFADMPGGALGFLIVVNLLVFILGLLHRLLRDRLHRDPDAGAGGREDPAVACSRPARRSTRSWSGSASSWR
jgi:hypothetical protein